MQGAEVLTKFTADVQDVKKKMPELQKTIDKTAKAMGAAFIASVGVATGALTGLIKSSIKAVGEMEQLAGGAKKIFDEIDYKQIEADAVTAYKNMNMSAREYMSAINTVGATFAQTMGDKKGYDTAKQGLQAIADYASGTGTDVNLLTEKFKAITRSTTSYLSIADQFAGLLPQTTDGFLKQAQQAGYLSKEYKKLNQVPVAEYQEAIAKMLELGVKDMGLLGNTAAEAEGTLTGSIASVKGAWDNFISGVGSIDDVITTILAASQNIADTIINMLPVLTDGLVKLMDGMIPQIPNLIQKLLPSIVRGGVLLVQGFINSLPAYIQMLAGMLPQIITALINGFIVVVNALAEQAPVLIPIIIDAILECIPMLIDNIPLFINAGAKLIGGLIAGIINSIPILLGRIAQIVVSMVKAWKEIDMLDIGKNMIKGLWNGLKGMKDWVINKVKDMGKSILNGLKKVLGISSPSKEFAIVGKYSAEGYVEGLEDMQKQVDATVGATFNPFNNATIGSMTASTPSPNITVQNSMKMDALGQLVNNVKTFSGGAKNDYNYVGGY